MASPQGVTRPQKKVAAASQGVLVAIGWSYAVEKQRPSNEWQTV
jgi:hypothetical protein